MTNKNYKLKIKTRFVRDASSVKFHVDNNDYFGTAATLVNLLYEQFVEQIKTAPQEEKDLINKTFQNLIKDLLILQQNYHIKANKLKNHKDDKGRLKSQ